MINHIRTILLNIPDLGDKSEGIPAGYIPLVYNRPLAEFQNIIIPATLSRFYKKLLVYIYLRYMSAAGLGEDTKLIDKRLTYDLQLDKSEFFQFTRLSNTKLVVPTTPKVYDTAVVMSVHGKYVRSAQLDEFYEKINVRQIAGNVLRISSVDNNGNVLNNYVNADTLSWSGPSNTGISSLIPIGSTGLAVSFSAEHDFTADNSNSSPNKAWEFIAEAPINFSLDTLIDKLNSNSEIVRQMLLQPALTDTSKYDNLWTGHFNKVYRVAGLVMGFALRACNINNTI